MLPDPCPPKTRIVTGLRSKTPSFPSIENFTSDKTRSLVGIPRGRMAPSGSPRPLSFQLFQYVHRPQHQLALDVPPHAHHALMVMA